MSRARREDVLAKNSHNGDGSGQQTVDDLLAKYAAQLEGAVNRIDELEQRVAALEERLENERQSPADDDLCTLERYAAMPSEDREDLISTSQQRAVTIFENWWDMAEETPKGYVVSTRRNSSKKHNPCQFKLDLERATGESLEWMQVYRAMEEVARLSGGEESRDEYDRLHIHGGAFELHEKPTPDGEQLYKVLHLAEPNSVTLL